MTEEKTRITILGTLQKNIIKNEQRKIKAVFLPIFARLKAVLSRLEILLLQK
jgi:hypothetical protein